MTQLAKLNYSDAAKDAPFGKSVSINSDGSRVAVGPAHYVDYNGSYYHNGIHYVAYSVSVYLFDGSGELLATLTASDVAEYDLANTPLEGMGAEQLWAMETEQQYFSFDGTANSIAISSDGSRVAVGTPSPFVGLCQQFLVCSQRAPRSVYLFDGAGEQLARLTASDGTSDLNFGYSIAISSDGSRVAVGSPPGGLWAPPVYLDEGHGAVYLFDGAGEQLAKLNVSDVAEYDAFGHSVAMSSDGSQVVVGDPAGLFDGKPCGAVYLFDGAGEQLARLNVSDGVGGDAFGFSVAISSDGSRVAVGAPFDFKGSGRRLSRRPPVESTPAPFFRPGEGALGSVYLFDGAGEQLARLSASDGALGDAFGFSVAISSDGSRVAVGAPFDSKGSGRRLSRRPWVEPTPAPVFEPNEGAVGSVYLFDGAGEQLAKQTDLSDTGYGAFGRSVAVNCDGSRVAVGAPRDLQLFTYVQLFTYGWIDVLPPGSVYVFESSLPALAPCPSAALTASPSAAPTAGPSAAPTAGPDDLLSGARRAGRLLAPLAAMVLAGCR
jgi:hypothetical protein